MAPIVEAFIDTLKMFPYLFVACLVIEWIAHRAGDSFKDGLRRFGRLGSVGGAALGLFPQCGFSVAAADLYADRIITPGTLIAVFIATSDEALPVLLADSSRLGLVAPLLATKFVIAVIAGLFVDFALGRLWRPSWEAGTELHHHHGHADEDGHDDDEEGCHHHECHGGIFGLALAHSARISLLIFVVTALLNIGLDALGEERTRAFLMSGNRLQPLLAAIFGLVPSCAASVFLTEMYVQGSLSFGSVVAGLSTSAGAGILVLCRMAPRKRDALRVLAFILVVAAATGTVIDLVHGM
ncbi:MAG: arsenic efflux protein [Kiritimatiellae bacterium]|nr:arsenic efflux protein [Kiritimatiellia bacterium]